MGLLFFISKLQRRNETFRDGHRSQKCKLLFREGLIDRAIRTRSRQPKSTVRSASSKIPKLTNQPRRSVETFIASNFIASGIDDEIKRSYRWSMLPEIGGRISIFLISGKVTKRGWPDFLKVVMENCCSRRSLSRLSLNNFLLIRELYSSACLPREAWVSRLFVSFYSVLHLPRERNGVPSIPENHFACLGHCSRCGVSGIYYTPVVGYFYDGKTDTVRVKNLGNLRWYTRLKIYNVRCVFDRSNLATIRR